MAYVYKTIDKNEISIIPYQVHKTFTLTNLTASGSYGVYTYQAIHNPNHVNLQDDSPATTANGLAYKFITHASINQLYYQDFDTKRHELLDYHSKYEKRELHENAVAFSVPQNVYGDRIKTGTVGLTIAGRTVEEDSYGNLYDATRKDTVGSLLDDTNAYLISKVDFNDGYLFKNKLIAGGNLIEKPQSDRQVSFKNLKFPDGTYGKKALFLGSGSQAIVPTSEAFDFSYTKDFFISMMLEIPSTQPHITDSTNFIVRKGIPTGSTGPYPFSLEVYNSGGDEGKLVFKRYDGQTTNTITSTIDVNDGVTRHIGLRKSGSLLQLWIDGSVDGSTTAGAGDVVNSDDLYLGHNFSGSLDEFKIFRNSFTTTKCGNYGDYEKDSDLNYHVGNVFYKTGMVVITNPYTEYAALAEDTGSYTFTCRGTRNIEEYEILCQVEGSEFNHTVNKSSATLNDDGAWEYNDDVNNEYFNPYVSQIGLYNDAGQLIMVAKPSQPIKIPTDKNITFVVRFDV